MIYVSVKNDLFGNFIVECSIFKFQNGKDFEKKKILIYFNKLFEHLNPTTGQMKSWQIFQKVGNLANIGSKLFLEYISKYLLDKKIFRLKLLVF